MFVGITRAQQELQISLARYRDFRGQRKTVIPSSFLMELPREEMSLEYGESEERRFGETVYHDVHDFLEDAIDSDSFADFQLPSPCTTAATEGGSAVAARAVIPLPLTTAAELANGGAQPPPADPDAFHQGMVVRHPTFGLGRVAALSGSGAARKATIDFAASAGRKRFVLSKSPLRPVKGK
jgi:DNA helicase-2/ATP-dependent DNA helicase PcrA